MYFNFKTQEIRQVTHLQYTSWPDHGTPSPLELLEFYRYVSKAMEQHSEQKIIVHCRFDFAYFFTMPLLWYQPWFDCNIHEQIVKILSHVLVKKRLFIFRHYTYNHCSISVTLALV